MLTGNQDPRNVKGSCSYLGVRRFLEWEAMDSRGVARGIMVLWDNRVLELVNLEKKVFSISYHFKNYYDGFIWNFTEVYGLTLKRDRECFRGELGAIKGLWNGPWCVAREFNSILSPE